MELRHLRYFVVVAEEQNVTRAAARLHLSQPPLSRQIHDLEEELGVELFQRTAKSLALTEAGKVFLGEARLVLLRVDQAVEKVRAAAKNLRGHLRVGYAPSLTAKFLPDALRSFEHEFPEVRVSLHDLSSEECMQKLAAEKIDIALTVKPAPSRLREMSFERLTAYPLVCAVAACHPFAGRRSLKPAQLKDHAFVIYSPEDYPEYLKWLRRLFRSHGFAPTPAGEYDGVTGLITAVESGRGIAVVPSSSKFLAGPGIKLIPLSPSLSPLVVGAVFAKTRSKLVEKFVLALKQAIEGTAAVPARPMTHF
jgi:DNA-binding transcriptional LysR family regulator